MPNEFIARNGITSLGNVIVTGSLTTTGTINMSGSIASSSFATNAATASSADDLLVRSTLTAQTLVVQTITSSVDFVTGSTQFGSLLSNTHVFSGSVTMNPGGLFVSSSGRVGIGTTNPTKALEILSNTSQDGIKISGTSNPRLTIIDTTNNVQFDALTTDTEAVLRTDTNHSLHLSTNGTARLIISSSGAASFSGSVDIQNANKLSIYRADNARALQLYTTNNECVVDSWEASSEPLHIRSMGSGGRIQFFTSGSEKMRIASDGKVGIGTSTPSGSRLHVFIGNDGGSGTPGVILATSNGVNDIVRFQDGTTTVL